MQRTGRAGSCCLALCNIAQNFPANDPLHPYFSVDCEGALYPFEGEYIRDFAAVGWLRGGVTLGGNTKSLFGKLASKCLPLKQMRPVLSALVRSSERAAPHPRSDLLNEMHVTNRFGSV
jgi:hypothetical protein